MALPRFEKLDRDRRNRVIVAAAVEFAAKGYEGATLVAITESLGLGKASLYYYVADKADLCKTVVEDAWARLRYEGHVDLGALTAGTFWPTFDRLSREILELCASEPWLLAVSRLLNSLSRDPSARAVLSEYDRRRRDWEEVFVRRGQELGVIRKDLPASLLLAMHTEANQASNHWFLDHMDELEPDESKRLALLSFRAQRTMLSPPVERRGASAGRLHSAGKTRKPKAAGRRAPRR